MALPGECTLSPLVTITSSAFAIRLPSFFLWDSRQLNQEPKKLKHAKKACLSLFLTFSQLFKSLSKVRHWPNRRTASTLMTRHQFIAFAGKMDEDDVNNKSSLKNESQKISSILTKVRG
jgi:hypothetical protein